MSLYRKKIVVLCLFYFFFQLITLNYGTKLNDFEYFIDYKPSIEVNYAKRSAIVAGDSNDDEGLDRWIMRFKIYSIEMDEVYNIMALSRIKPQELKFDPHYYQYGGAFIYPLGAFYFALQKLGVIYVTNLDGLLANPQIMDDIYIYGRAFVLFFFTLSALFLYKTFRLFVDERYALLAISIYLFAPSSIMFSQVLKPHWYALFFTNLAIYKIAKIYANKSYDRLDLLIISGSIGLAFGSAQTFYTFTIAAWFALLVLVLKRVISFKVLFIVPIVAFIFFTISNPYVFLNYEAFRLEREAQNGWFFFTLNPIYVWLFLKNSYFHGFGLFFGGLVLIILLKELIKPSFEYARLFAIMIAITLIACGLLTASINEWHVNFRYMPHFLPMALLFILFSRFGHKKELLLASLILLILQSAPLKLAYFDENNPKYSTKLLSAEWIHKNIPKNSEICIDATIAPSTTPPFNLKEYNVKIGRECEYVIKIFREMDLSKKLDGYKEIADFKPRFSAPFFPLVFSHINPEFVIYKKLKSQKD